MRISSIINYSQNKPSFKSLNNKKSEMSNTIGKLNSDFQEALNKHPKEPAVSYYSMDRMFDSVARFEQLRKRLEEINAILDNSKGANYSKDRTEITKYLEQIEGLSKNKGFNRIYGYDGIKENLYNEFIIKVMAKDKTSQKSNVPNAFLFYGSNGCGKSLFAKALAEQTLSDVKTVKFDIGKEDSEKDVFKQIIEIAEQSKINWDNNPEDKKRTIILLDEADYFLDKNSPILEDFKEFLKDCSEEYKCTVFLTTNYPFDIDESILSDEITPYKLYIPKADKETAKTIIQNRIKTLKRPNVNVNEIVNELFKDRNKSYSNGQIVSIIDETGILNGKYTTDDYIETIRQTVPNIQNKDLEQYKEFEERNNTLLQFSAIKLDRTISDNIKAVKSSINAKPKKPEQEYSLADYQKEIAQSIDIISQNDELNYDLLNGINIRNTSLPDFWLTLEGDNSNNDTQRTKEKEINQILLDETRKDKLVSQTIAEFQRTNSIIESTKNVYKDIIENERELTQEQKDILIRRQDSKLLFDVVTNGLESNNTRRLELNTIKTLRQLSNEKDTIRQNAKNNIFNPARKMDLEDENNKETVGYILNMLSQKAIVSNPQEKEELKNLIEVFEYAINSGNKEEFKSYWQKMVNIAQEYFESKGLEYITDRNIELLNSINKNMKDVNNPRILSLINDSSLTIEQKEFILRYKKDNNFTRLISNPNVDIESVMEELILFEAANRDIIDNYDLDISYKKVMSDKFHQIDSDAKDINIQGNKISDKLVNINDSIKEQSEVISIFAQNFTDYADKSLTLQSIQLQELVSINQNTSEIKAYTQALTRTKLVELQRDKYYKDIVPEITKLLPENEQIDLKDFLSKIDELARNEKDALRKKKLIKAGLIIAGTIAVAAGIYYFGPSVVAHLASKLPSQVALKTATTTAAKAGLARSIGTSQLNFTSKGGIPRKVSQTMDTLRKSTDPKAKEAYNEAKSTISKNGGNISQSEFDNILTECGID